MTLSFNYRQLSLLWLTLFGDISWELCASIADALDDLLLPYTIDLSVFAQLNHPELEAHIERVGLVFYEKNAHGGAGPVPDGTFPSA